GAAPALAVARGRRARAQRDGARRGRPRVALDGCLETAASRPRDRANADERRGLNNPAGTGDRRSTAPGRSRARRGRGGEALATGRAATDAGAERRSATIPPRDGIPSAAATSGAGDPRLTPVADVAAGLERRARAGIVPAGTRRSQGRSAGLGCRSAGA